MVFETLCSTLSYAKEKIKRFSYVTLVIKSDQSDAKSVFAYISPVLWF